MSVLVSEYCAMVNYGARTPPYRQIETILRDRIADGTYLPGERLPGTRGLMQEFGVAQLTAQKSLRELIKRGLAVRTHGLGTYVSDNALEILAAEGTEGTSGAHKEGE